MRGNSAGPSRAPQVRLPRLTQACRSILSQVCRPFICPACQLRLTQARRPLISQVRWPIHSQVCGPPLCSSLQLQSSYHCPDQESSAGSPAPDQESSAGSPAPDQSQVMSPEDILKFCRIHRNIFNQPCLVWFSLPQWKRFLSKP